MGFFGRKIHVTETPDVRHITNVDVMHEESDVNVKGVATFVALLAVGGVVICVIIFGLFRYFDRRDPRSNLALKEPDAEWKLLRQKYDYDLTTYGQPDPSTNTVRVPIDEAMRRL